VGIIPDIRSSISVDLKKPGNLLYIVGKTFKELGGSEYYKLKGFLGKSVPAVHAVQARKTYYALTKAIGAGCVKACHDLSEGGLAVSIAEMAMASDYGAEIDFPKVPSEPLKRDDFVLFSESNSRFIVEVAEKDCETFETMMKGRVFAEIGRVTKKPRLMVQGLNHSKVLDIAISDLHASWKRTLSSEV
jgi:phosphoribosylformylglycinamidine synthase